MTPVSLQVAPAALSDAGVSIAGLGDGLTAAVGALTAAYNANTGQDAAGSAFGVAYRDSAKAVVDAAAAGVNALRNTGYKIQGSASNYSQAEAAADIRGGAVPLPPPPAPTTYSAPSDGPDVNGSGVAAPLLWGLVEALVGDFWPNGRPNEMRSAAAAWSVFATPLYNVTSDNAGPYGVIDAQQIPEKEKMKAAVRDIGTAMASLAGEAQSLAGELNNFATEVETTQNAIRNLLDTLKSVIGSIVDKGILGTVIELVTDDAEEKIQQVANDIKAVIANHRRQVEARKQAIGMLISSIRSYSRAMEIVTRGELVHYLGEDAGRIVANINDAITDTSVGIANGAINTAGGLTTLDPIGDPKGTWATIEGLSKTAMTLNPMTLPTALATDPKGTVDTLKDVTHFDDIVTSDRPFIGVGELGFDIGTAVVPGGAAAKAGAGARAAEGAAARSELTTSERVAGEVAEMGGTAGRLEGVADAAGGAKAELDDLSKNLSDGGKPLSGSPSPLPKPAEPGLSAPHEPGPSPVGGKPTSAPLSGESVTSPVAHAPEADTPNAAPAPKAEVPSAPAVSEPASSPSAPSAELAGAADSSSASAPAAGSVSGARGHASNAMPSEVGNTGDRMPVAVGAHGSEEVAGGGMHDPHPGGGDGGRGSHGGSSDHGGGGHWSGGGHGEPPNHGTSDGNTGSGHRDSGLGSASSGDPLDGRDLLRARGQGEHWDPVSDGPDNPHYGEPLDRPGTSPDPGPVTDQNRDTWRLFQHPDELYGHDAHGNPLTKEQYDERYRELQDNGEVWDKYPPNAGAVSGTRVRFDSIRAFIEFFGAKVDRVGWPGGEYLGIMEHGLPAPFEARGLPLSSLEKPYYQYNLTGVLPEGWSIEVSEIAPAFGRDGGGLQLVVYNRAGREVTVEDLIESKVLDSGPGIF